MYSKAWATMLLVILLTGCSQNFPEIPWSESDLSYRQTLNEQNDYDSRLELARLDFTHNFINDADGLLSQLVAENPEDMEAKAWYSANNCKLAGRKGPWLLGFDKLYDVWRCLSDLQVAAEKAPENFTISMIQINTYAEVDMFRSRKRATILLEEMITQIDKKPNFYSNEAKIAIYEAATNLNKFIANKSTIIQSYLGSTH